MEAIIAVSLLLLLAFLAAHFGYDSRDGMRSKEEEFARQWWPGRTEERPSNPGA
jgi:hypothetical protein